MRLIFAIASLLAVAIALREARRPLDVHPRDVQQFQSGKEYRYQLDTQVSSGFATVSDQHAMTRIRAEVLLQFQSERSVVMRMEKVEMGTLNREVLEPEKVQPLQMFKLASIDEKQRTLFELPLQFDYADGIVENLKFHKDDQPWAKNIKRAVLNMLQSNLKQRTGLVDLEPIEKEYKDRETDQVSEIKMFTLPEMTLEGECQTNYVINRMTPQNKYNRYSEDSEEDVRMFNVTKTIDFKRCKKIADIRFGPKIELPCDKCNVEELEERKLDRTTIIRQVFVGTPEKLGIQKVEVISHYMFKMINAEEERPMRTIVASELNYVDAKDVRQRREENRDMGAEEKLIYSIEWDTKEKRFYMYGDVEFPQESPFKAVTTKVNTIEKSIIRLVNLWNDKVQGIESEGTGIFTKIVELTRMCTAQELREVYEKVTRDNDRLTGSDKQKAEDVIIDALANAGTYNTIKFLVDRILNKEIDTTRAVRAITHLKGLPVPSEKHVEELLRLCESSLVKRSGPLKQTSWLTTGAIIGELCDDEITREDGFERNLPKPMCQREQQQKFVKTIMESYKTAENRYEKILALKALGNAGLAESTPELEKIIRDLREDPMVRMQAIDSLRRLRAQMPHRIQRILLPIFQNVRERPEIRMACISMIFPTIPDKNMLDQIAYTLMKEPSRQVKSYVYSAMMRLSESTIEVEKELAKHLKSLLKLAGITEENEQEFLRGSRFIRVPFYSQKNREGLLGEIENMVGPDNYLPKRLTASIDALFSGILEKNGLELRVSQENLESWYHKLYESMVEPFSYGNRREPENRGRRNQRESSSEESQERVESIYKKLGVNKRSRNQFSSVDSDAQGAEPYGMFTFRYADVDYVILPIEDDLIPESIKEYITSGKKPTFRDFDDWSKLFQGRNFRVQAAFNLLDSIVKIPTSSGLPIRMVHLVPVLGSVDGTIKARLNGKDINVETNLHPIMTASHLKRVEIWSPIVMTGAETSQTVELNWPINSELKIEYDSKKSASWAIKIPETKTQIFGLHTLPHTFVAEIEKTSQMPRMASIKKIDNQRLQQQLRSYDDVYGEESINLPLKVVGDMHMPHELTNYKKIINTLLTSENHIHAIFEPNQRTPKQIVLTVDGEAFQQHDDLESHRQLKSFYSNKKFDDEYEREYQREDEDENDERQLSSYLDEYKPRKMYKHQARVQLKTVDGSNSLHRFGEMSVEAACDERVKYCQGKLEVRRSPFLRDERGEWKFEAKAQTLYPEYVSDIDDLDRQNTKNKKFVAKIDAEWGTSDRSDRKQSVNLKINGEQFKPKQWIQKISGVQHRDQDYKSLDEQMKRRIAFLNKYDIFAEYNLQQSSQSMFYQYFGGLKAWEFWSTSVQSQRNPENTVRATVLIDPITHEHLNMTIKTPTERVVIDSIKLPMKAKLFSLVRESEGHSRSNSFMDVVRSYSSQTRPECKVDGRKVQTFDDVTYKAPLTKCYSVLAKDCSSETPRFAVLMKKLGSGEDKKLKLVSGKQIVEVQPDKNGKLIVKVNGDKVEDTQELLDYGIDYTEEMVHIDTRDVSVRFSGRKIWIKLAQTHKNTQCGLCGHYNDDGEDEFRMANNKHTNDLKDFHRGYTLVDEKCRTDMDETYNNGRYEREDSVERSWEVRKDSREDREDREGRHGGKKEKKEKNEREGRDEKDEKRPIEKTDVQEFNHKVCFSANPIKECPRGYRPDKKEDKKIKYICFPRNDSEARRLLREARRNPKATLDLPEQNPSFTETSKVPVTCKSY